MHDEILTEEIEVTKATASAAAARLRDCLQTAREDNHYRDAWYVHMARWDIETIIDYVLGKDVQTYMTGAGQKLVGIHDPISCAGRPCVIHNPSDHSMRSFPTLWRGDRGIMERTCPHGIGHPDPDDMEYIRLSRGDEVARAEGVHGCDGCCS